MTGTGLGLRGRRRERETLDGLVDAARAGRSQVLVLRGEPGVGKTALLHHVRDRASGCRIVQATGVESEMELAYAGLHQLCAPILDRTERLPGPQRDALGTAFGTMAGDPPDVFLVGLAVLGLLSETAGERPLICLVDDAQWLDRSSAHALAFVARRLLADSVAMVFTKREPWPTRELDGLPDHVVDGLSYDDARALLEESVPGRLDPQVRDRIVAETRGNPLALLELTRRRSPAELAGGFAVPGTGPLASRIEQSFEERVRALPTDGQMLLRIAAAEPLGDVPLLWRAADSLGIGVDAAASVEEAGLLELRARARFPHPLVRSAAYRSATPRDRRTAHRALAEATDPDHDPDRRAWHRGQAIVEPDEAVAVELETSAGAARRRGGAAATAAFLKRAAELTPDPRQRGARALDAARAQLDAASPQLAAELLDTADLAPLDELQRATAVELRARIAFTARRGSDAPRLLLDAARRLERLDPVLAREAHLETLGAAIFAGCLTTAPTVAEVAAAARQAPPAPEPPRLVDLLVNGLATRFTDGYVSGLAPLQLVLERLRDDAEAQTNLRWLWLACRIASDLWDDEAMAHTAERQIRLARATGALTVLPMAVVTRAGVHVHEGEFDAASALNDESTALTSSVGGAPLLYTVGMLAAWRGDESTAATIAHGGVEEATARGEGRALSWGDYMIAVLNNGLGNYPVALAAAQVVSDRDDLAIAGWGLFELIEAAVRCDRPDLASSALDRLTDRTQATGTPWARGVEARSRALLSHGDAADGLYTEAIEALKRTRVAVHLARTHLVYGEWLRRENRRVDARDQLRTAHEMFRGFGADAFAERAQRELLATGETVRRRSIETAAALTAQEAQIARLARDGLTNPEIGSQLFISPRTVEYHLRKVFTKLDISSRRELRRAPLTDLQASGHERNP